MKVLVTGGTGFVGGHLVRRLVKKGFDVRALVRKSSNIDNLKKLDVEIVLGDITDKDSVKKAIKGIEKVFHIGALFRQSGFPDSTFWEINVGGPKNMLEASLENGVERFIHCSTVGVLSHISNPPADETYPYSPGDIYQETKTEGEKLALKFFREEGLPGAVIRPAMIYGPGDTRILKLFKLIANRKFIMLGTGKTLAHFVYIDDLIDGFELCAEKSSALGEVYIIAGQEPITLNELVALIAKELNVPVPKLHLPVRPFQVLGSLCEAICKPFGIEPPIFRRRVDFFTKDRAFDISKARRDLGYHPKMDMVTGISRTIEWYSVNKYL